MDMEKKYSIRDLELIFSGSTSVLIAMDFALASSHGARVDCVNRAIDYIAQSMAKTPQHRQNMSEDALTIEFVNTLKAIGMQAGHDTQYGGHCDIVIEGRDDFLWIGEAKIHSSYDWLFKGFQHLDTRYSTGSYGQDHGWMIIYIKGTRIDNVMAEWGKRLVVLRPDVSIVPSSGNDSIMNTEHTHQRTGRKFNIRHIPVSLYFKPEDG